MMNHYRQIKNEIEHHALKIGRNPADILLLAVSKNQPCLEILEVYNEGCSHFGENRVQEALEKIEQLPHEIKWHFIGTLQSKKVPKIIQKFTLIHSVDSWELAEKISLASERANCLTSILLQVNTSGERTKHGLTMEQWDDLIVKVDRLPGIQLEGLMTMAPLTEDQDVVRKCFKNLRDLHQAFKSKLANPMVFKHLSMGMSNDWQIAIEEGATIVRLGTAIFAE